MKKEAWECFTRCIDITPAMAREFIKVSGILKLEVNATMEDFKYMRNGTISSIKFIVFLFCLNRPSEV